MSERGPKSFEIPGKVLEESGNEKNEIGESSEEEPRTAEHEISSITIAHGVASVEWNNGSNGVSLPAESVDQSLQTGDTMKVYYKDQAGPEIEKIERA